MGVGIPLERLVTRARTAPGASRNPIQPEFEREGYPDPHPRNPTEKGPHPGALSYLRRFFFFGGLGGGLAAAFSAIVGATGAGISLLTVIPWPMVQRLVVIQ